MRLFVGIFIGCLLVFIAKSAPLNSYAKSSSLQLSSNTGDQGCVVSGNSLYVNGIKEKDLTGSEISEYNRYQNELNRFQERVRQIMGTRIPTTQNPRHGGITYDTSVAGPRLVLPDPPQRPAFCSYNMTIQHIFDGCKVQNNKLYIGNQYVRELTPNEQYELKIFDEQMSRHQEKLFDRMKKRLDKIFDNPINRNVGSHSESRIGYVHEQSTAPLEPLQLPEAPNFCTRI